MYQKTFIIAVLLCSTLRPTWQINTGHKVKSQDFNMAGIFQKISNLEFVAFDKTNSAPSTNSKESPESIQMLQLDHKTDLKKSSDSSSISRAFGLDTDDLNEVMQDTFRGPPQKEASISEILHKQDQKEYSKGKKTEDKQETQELADEGINEEEMTITEQLKQVKVQTQNMIKQQKKDKVEAEKKKVADKKKKELDAKRAKANQKQTDEQEMDDFIEKQMKEQKAYRAQYDKEHLSDDEIASKDPSVKEDVDEIISSSKRFYQHEKEDKEVSFDDEENKKSFTSAEEAIESFGTSLAQHQFEKSNKKKRGSMSKKQQRTPQQIKKDEEEKKEKIEQEKKDKEEQRLLDERQNKLQEKLDSLKTGDEASTSTGFMSVAKDQYEEYKKTEKELQEERFAKQRVQIAKENLEDQEDQAVKELEDKLKVKKKQETD